jgi:ABC-type dipeptide/oligopeptide/nickel transport system permease subunit
MAAVPAAAQARAPSRWARWWKSISIIFDSRVATVGMAMVLFWVLVGFVSLFWTPHPPNSSLFVQNLPPNATNWLGTDHLGRDIASRLMTGTQVILLKTRLPRDTSLGGFFIGLAVIPGLYGLVSVISAALRARRDRARLDSRALRPGLFALLAAAALVALSFPMQRVILPPTSIPGGVALWGVFGSLLVGSILGLNAGYRGGWWDQIIMQGMDALVAFPVIVLYLVVIAALGQGDLVVILAITVTGAPGVARLVRSLAMDIKTRDYIRAAETRGESANFIMFREILPNARGPILVDAMLRVGYAIFAIGTLGFLGIGLPPPDPDWGNMVNDARKFIFSNQLAVIWPAITIASLVVGLNLFADGLREELARYQK